MGEEAYNHLEAHWKSPCRRAVDVACSELNPKGNENTEINKTLENADDTTTNPTTSLITIPNYKVN